MAPDILLAGYVTRDLVEGREQVGGSSFYGARTALVLGLKAGIWTSAEKTFIGRKEFAGLEVAAGESETTTFTHLYDGGSGARTLRCDARARPLDPAVLPPDWRRAPLVVLAPNGGEITPEAFSLFESRFTALLPQGWFRVFHPDGKVSFGPARFSGLPSVVNLIVVSEDDLAGDPSAWSWIRASSKIAVRTKGRKGYLLAVGHSEEEFTPPYVAQETDPTGAGDVFAVAMLIALSEGADPKEAARFGSVAASFSVEGPGVENLPTRAQIAERLRTRI
jgi:hypothetical protein